MADFNLAIPETLKFEGGYANSKADTGGETFAGISRVNNPHWGGWKAIDSYIAVNGLNKINSVLLSDAELMSNVRGFYKVNYWDSIRLGDLRDQQLANNAFDCAVNMGTGRAAKFLQQAANNIGAKLIVDGVIGPQTIKGVNDMAGELVYNQFNLLRKAKYDAIVDANPSQKAFYKSWMSRVKPYI